MIISIHSTHERKRLFLKHFQRKHDFLGFNQLRARPSLRKAGTTEIEDFRRRFFRLLGSTLGPALALLENWLASRMIIIFIPKNSSICLCLRIVLKFDFSAAVDAE